MKNIYSLFFALLTITALAGNSNPQKTLKGSEAAALVKQSKRVLINEPSRVPSFVEFNGSITVEKSMEALKPALKLRQEDALLQVKVEADKLGMQHYKYQQYYKGVKVEEGIYYQHAKDGSVQTANGFFVDDLNFSVAPSVSAQDAVTAGLKAVGATLYKWQMPQEEALLKKIMKDPNATYYPHPELLITAKDADYKKREMVLAYKFDVYADKPMSREFIYVDAQTGKVIRRDNRICFIDAAGTGTTRYSGSQSFTTDDMGGGNFRLREAARSGVETYNMLTGTNYGAAVDFTNVGNSWTGLNNPAKDDAALDAHWGAEKTYDYYLSTFARNSFDNAGGAILNYVHYDVNYDNAYWNGFVMTYGDGSNVPGGFTPLPGMDVCGHEISHGVDQYAANLTYQNESGALNESFSDIFGTAVEFYAKPLSANFFIGEDVVFGGGALRDMSNPNNGGQPDTYLGNFWYNGVADNGGVHTNSGVQNFWYYLLCQGGSGTNDIGNAYSVTAIGMAAASAIAYRNLTVYLNPSSQYIDARTGSIQAAVDLYGSGSAQEIAVTNAWYAVGIGAAYVAPGGTYVSNTAGSWDVTTNWTPNGRPGTGDIVTVNHAMTLASNVDILDVTVNGGGSIAVGSLNLVINGTVAGTGTISSSTTGTVTYNKGSNGQNVLAGTYGNLIFSNFSKTLASSGNIDISGTFTPGNGVGHTITGSTIRYTNTGVAIQTVVAFNYNNLTVLNSTSPGYKDFSGNAIVDGVFTPPTNLRYCTGCNNSTITFNSSGSQTIPAFEYQNLASTNTGARVLANAGTIGIYGTFTPGANTYTNTGSTISYKSNGNQTIVAFNYNNLTVLNSNSPQYKDFSGNAIVDGVFTPPTNNRYCTGCSNSTITFNGSGSQTIPVFEYYNLASSNSGARVLATNGTIGIYGTFTPGNNTYTVTGSTISYSGTGNQTVQPFSYYNLRVVGSNAGFYKQFSGMIHVSNVFTPPTNLNYNTAGGTTIDYNGTGTQTIAGNFSYGNLTSSSTGARILQNGFIIDVYGTFTPGNNPYTITGSTIRYNGNSAQTITSFTYNSLATGGTGTRTWGNAVIIQGNFTSGTHSWVTGGTTVTFSGNANQTISSGTSMFNNLTINKTGGTVSVTSGTHTITGALTISSATTLSTVSNTVVLQSDATATARIAPLASGASITGGGFVVQRYISARVANYADLASPVQASTIADWDTRPDGTNEIFMGGVNGPDGNAFGNGNSVYTWNEPTAAFVPVTSQATVLTPGKGFELFLGDNLQNLAAKTIDTRGTPNQGTQNPAVTHNGTGYNLIGNPFASFISWNTVLANSANMDNTYTIFDATSGTYLSYGAGTEIPSTQGFWVHFTGAPSLSIPESAKTTTTSSVFHKTGEEEPFLSLKISKEDQSISYYHITKIDLNNTNQPVYDKGDMPFQPSPVKEAPFITTTTTDGQQLCINRLGRESSVDVAVQAGVGISGNYNIDVEGLEYVSEYNCVTLEDKLTHTIIDLRSSQRYTFNINTGDDKDRFVLHFSQQNDCAPAAVKTKPAVRSGASDQLNIIRSAEGNTVVFDLENAQKATIKVVNMLGQNIVDEIETTVQKQRLPVVLPQGYSGVYYIIVTTDNKALTKKFIALN